MPKIPQEIQKNTVKKKSQRWKNVLKKQAKAFCLGTGLHGYKYVAQSHRSKIERIIWAIIVGTSLTCAGELMRIAWQYNSARPTVTVIESTHRGIWNYPFPAVTICNMNRVSLSRAREFSQHLVLSDNMTADFILSQMGLLNELLNPGIHDEDVQDNLTRLQSVFDDNNYSIQKVIEEVTQNCSSLVLGCKWKGTWTNCSDLFVPSYSREGACCSFNYLTTKDPRKQSTIEPYRVTACGYQTGLTVFVNPDANDYAATILGSYGVKLMVHYPYDFPDHNAENKLVGLNSQMFVSISPEETYSTEEVKSLSVKTRDCIFSEEKQIGDDYDIMLMNLTYEKYTYKNCLAACRAATIKEKCQCIPYYYPQQGTRVCDLNDVKCLNEYKSWYETSWPGVVLTSETISSMTDEKKKNYGKNRPCGCMPDCVLFRYPIESSVGMMDRSGESKAVPNGSMIHVFFSDLVSIQYRRHANYNWRNVFASFGGLLGLFAGFSLMSGYELIYFFVIRVIADACMKKKVEKTNNIEKLNFDSETTKRRRF
ncbi:sodium channel protein Nach-like [Venturia canescens]|uniref:sodium channel protein Nach-like n=1 Tax=Venturia canescens TaxID=32260 RepID=UPI001C9C1340|nr:sodium channel protein Nach-like [Venturia canescens]